MEKQTEISQAEEAWADEPYEFNNVLNVRTCVQR